MSEPTIYLDGRVAVHPGDCLATIKTLPENSIDACVTDPPYALVSITKRFGAENAAKCKPGKTGAYQRASAGFMGKKWDTGETAFSVDFWREVLRVLKPGAHVVAFGGTRSYHRLACAIEDAGFECRDAVMWHYGVGFPKSHDVSKGIQKSRRSEDEGEIRVICRFVRSAMDRLGMVSRHLTDDFGGCNARLIDHWAARDTDSQPSLPTSAQWAKLKHLLALGDSLDDLFDRLDARRGELSDAWNNADVIGEYEGEPGGFGEHRFSKRDNFIRAATDTARDWDGWGTALKPATEIIFVGRKPLSTGSVAANVLRWGTGAINVDACRVGTGGRCAGATAGAGAVVFGDGLNGTFAKPVPGLGRWPANLVHDGSPEVLAAFPEVHGAGAARDDVPGGEYDGSGGIGFTLGVGRKGFRIGDPSGSAARFFASFPQEKEPRCDLCGLLCGHQSDINQPCNANNAELSSSTGSTSSGASVPNGAAASRLPEGAVKSNQSRGHVISAESHLWECRQLSGDSVRQSAPTPTLSRIAQNVRCAANLCDSCATAIAHGLVALRTRQSEESLPLPDFISERSAQILRQSLALYVEGRHDTDIILTIPSLKQLFGSVFHAIANCTPRLRADGERAITPKQSSRVFYSSKADQDSRLGSRHPTVKPLALMQYLCRLVCPPGGTVLDPFAGTGTTGEAAWREGFNAVLCERETEYLADIARRMKLCLAGPDERARESIKARNAGKPDDHGPLFGGTEYAGGAKYNGHQSKFYVGPIERSDQRGSNGEDR